MQKTIVALYDNIHDAEGTIRDLEDRGFSRDQISLVAGDKNGEMSRRTSGETSGAAQGAGIGAGVGAALGGVGGLLVGLGALAIPGIGPVLAAGPLAAALGGIAGAGAGAVAGGAAGGLIGGLTEMGVTEDQAQNFAEGIRRGGTLVTLMADENRSGQAKDIMNNHNPVDVNERASQWRQSGWQGFNSQGEPGDIRRDQEMGSNATFGGNSTTGAATGSGNFDTGRAMDDDEMGDSGMGAATMNDTGTTGMDNHPQPRATGYTDYSGDVNRGGNVDVTPPPADTTPIGMEGYTGTDRGLGSRNFAFYENDFRNHFSSAYASRGMAYNDYVPAYQYGYDLGNNPDYQGQSWTVVEPEARSYWEERNPGTWDQIKDAVKHAWESVTNSVS
jgi:hypothetical protein